MEANEETSEKENMKNRRYEERKKEKVEVGLVAARETEASGTTELAKWTTENLSTDPTIECGTCFSVSAEIFSLESPENSEFCEKIHYYCELFTSLLSRRSPTRRSARS